MPFLTTNGYAQPNTVFAEFALSAQICPLAMHVTYQIW